MKESMRNEIIRLKAGGASMRRIARLLCISRHSVSRVLSEHGAAREGSAPPEDLPKPRTKRPSCLDKYVSLMQDLLDRFPNITATRMWEELRDRGFKGQYSIVRERVRVLRPERKKAPVIRFETGPGRQAQMDYSPYSLDFRDEGKTIVHAFSYVLGYSRRQYIRFLRCEDFQHTVESHVNAFCHLGGSAAVCLYDGMKVVVQRFDDEDEPIYNPRFLAFATHYGFRPWACRPRRPQTKGKVERPFRYLEQSLLNGRSFRDLDHLNEVASWWLREHADVRVHGETKERPIDRHQRELEFLLPLPEKHYEFADVGYRVVDVEGNIAYDRNFYSVPWTLIGDLVVVRATSEEITVYGKDILPVCTHPRVLRGTVGEKRECGEHRPKRKQEVISVLEERFRRLGTEGERFIEGLLESRRFARREATRTLELLRLYTRNDLQQALERACRYRAFRFAAVERILAVSATPRPDHELLETGASVHAKEAMSGPKIRPRETREYENLCDGKREEEDSENVTKEDPDATPNAEEG